MAADRKNLRDIVAEWIRFRFTNRYASYTAQTRAGAGPHPRARRPHDRVAERGQGHQDHPHADDPKAEVTKAFKLSERQADDILDIRLRQLAKLEHIKGRTGAQGIAEGTEGSPEDPEGSAGACDLVVAEIEADMKTFGDKRRTRIEESERR